MRKEKLRIGDPIALALIPCRECNERHVETVMELEDGKIYRSSWASENGKGHSNHPFHAETYIQMQRDEINLLLKKLRRLKP